MFKEEREKGLFDWSMLGRIEEGRPNLGNTTDVSMYRLMQFTLRDTLIQELGVKVTDHIFFEAGKTAGTHFYANIIPPESDLLEFMDELQEAYKKMKIGILRVEHIDYEALCFTLTISEDLDCSGLPICDEVVCTYDEGFIAGLLTAHTNRPFEVKEVDCWCSGARVCRFIAKPVSR